VHHREHTLMCLPLAVLQHLFPLVSPQPDTI